MNIPYSDFFAIGCTDRSVDLAIKSAQFRINLKTSLDYCNVIGRFDSPESASMKIIKECHQTILTDCDVIQPLQEHKGHILETSSRMFIKMGRIMHDKYVGGMHEIIESQIDERIRQFIRLYGLEEDHFLKNAAYLSYQQKSEQL